ncbi:MAG TPA: signal peptide peptidase SppA [Ignavibacteria bacterium]|jgi:protease-4
MKKNPLPAILLIIYITHNIYSQDFNLFNPSNEMYLFSAYDEGANGFRYNPAVLGLRHRLNITISTFLENYRGGVYTNEGDISLNTGMLGVAYRYSHPNFNLDLNSFFIGLGIGNKTLCGGLLFETNTLPDYGAYSNFQRETKAKNRFTFGILLRPFDFLSTALVVKTPAALRPDQKTAVKYTFGSAIRLLRNDLLTLLLDFSVLPFYSEIFDRNQLKMGIDVKVRNGIYLNGNYTLLNAPQNSTFINFGLKFDLPHTSIRYNNTFTRFGPNGFYNENLPYKSQGNHISLSYSLEKKESLVPEPKKIVEITLSGSLQDFNTEDVFFGLLGSGKRSVHEVIADIDYAAADPSVRGLLLKIYPLSTGRFEVSAAVEELTAALERFKKKGKHITAYIAQDAGPGEYYVATFANDIVLPADALFFYGLSIEIFNYKQFLQKYGIELQNFYAGEYKLVFQGILDSTTEKGKEVINRILDVVYDKMMSRIVTSRNLTLDDYLRDKLSKPLTGKEAERLRLVDINGWYEDAKEIAQKNGKTENIVKSLNRSAWDNSWGEPEQIAIIGVYGTIKPGESEAPSPIILPIPYISGGRSTGSETVIRQLENAFSNAHVKAVILRVDSGGGSALASSEINDAIIRLKKKYKKPLIVSMGNYAASGGYEVSVNADKIFADDLTVTGSIGVWASRPNVDSLMKDQKIEVEIFKRGEDSDIGSFFRKLDTEDVETIQGIIDFYYDRFIEAVADGRKLSKQEAEEVAKGRVWLGTDAFNKKLVDEIGGLYQAIIYAKKKTNMGKRYKLVYYAVPGGNTINELVSKSIVQYIQTNLLELIGFDEENQDLEIKY